MVAPYQMVGRNVIRGIIGCPATKQQYPIADGVADFTTSRASSPPPGAGELSVSAQTVQSLLGLTNPGGYVVLIGSAAKLALALSGLTGGVHFVGLNVSDGIEPTPSLSVLLSPYPLPLRTSMARGVVIGAEYATEPWLAEGGRLLLRGVTRCRSQGRYRGTRYGSARFGGRTLGRSEELEIRASRLLNGNKHRCEPYGAPQSRGACS